MESERTLVQAPLPRTDASPEEDPTRRIAHRRAPAREEIPQLVSPGDRDLVLGRYQLLERLGSGGFGVVWSAHDELLGRDVAVKRIWLGPDGDRERATREAQATARLAHPAIVALHEACVVEGAFYLISELVHGQTLAQLIARDELADEEVIEIGLALTGALTHAHARGVIHRDIKPQNVLVPDRPRSAEEAAKLTDFGGASLVGEDALTRTGDVLGTLAYMAPEQSEGGAVGAEADLYALALVLYEALSGVNPVRGATPAATARRIGRPLAELSRARRDLPRALTDALDGALAPAAEDRGSLEHLHLVLEDAVEQGLTPRRRRRAARVSEPVPTLEGGGQPLRRPLRARAHVAASPSVALGEGPQPSIVAEVPEHSQRLTLPRAVWIAAALLVVGWQVSVGRAGVGLLVLAALVPLIVAPSEPRTARVGAGWLVCLLAPVLGLAGLASAFPALAGQASRWRERLVHGALGYWWLVLAEPLLGHRLWLGVPAATPPRGVWEGSISTTAVQVILPLLTLGSLLGALLWGCGAALLPLLVRGRSAVLDMLAAVVWAGALAAATPSLVGGLAASGAPPTPRGLILAAVLAGLLAVAARALRGPV
ncbi:MAG TPA: serine/threonine-protein kinase [Solirubrobacteraceae bacterium]|nr:serine/threonine-protein kinase [Solirubrobacteraceae bacterium]